ncbi:NADH dehydrogenase [ubiquinone] 1 beta subcomplex subunit 5, mitochondrial-like [Ptychodera flava]|uniref:NADH dehydrogenase [ubiquinone] 1 beta subcomplex subunit 5, mitochondrial-like n=1 Tax=Ptychodera flava TaxID=63121 RepID=UPI00396A96B4
MPKFVSCCNFKMAATGAGSRVMQLYRLGTPLHRCNVLLQQTPKGTIGSIITRQMAGGPYNKPKFTIRPSKYSDRRFLDLFKHYVLLTAVPSAIVITYINIFIGEAEFAETPEDYEPKHWEYHQHPITRWIAKYITGNPQKDYEKMMDFLDIEMEKKTLREQEKQVRRLMRQRGDGHWYYYPTPEPKIYETK